MKKLAFTTLHAARLALLRESFPAIVVWPVCCLILVSIMWSGLFAHLRSEESEIRDDAFRHAASLSRAYAAQLHHTIEQLDQITLNLKYSWESASLAMDLRDQRDKGLYPPSAQLRVSLLDRYGDVVSSTVEVDGKYPNFSDSEYFRFHKQSAAGGLLISEPYPARLLKRPVLRFSRRLNEEDGTFSGVVIVVVEPNYLTTFHDEALLHPGDFISVRLAGGALLATKTGEGVDEIFYESGPVFDTASGVVGEPAEKFTDQNKRIVAWQKIEDYPLVAITGLSEQNIFAAFHERAEIYKIVAAAASIFLLFSMLVGMTMSARLAWRKQQADEVKATYRIATDAANEGFYMLRPLYGEDASVQDFQFEDCNQRGASMLSSSTDQVVGHSLLERIPEDYREGFLSTCRHALEHGFYEDELRVAPKSSLKAAWVYRRVVRSGSGLALTMRDISDIKAHEQALASQANTDALTGLPNRHWLADFLPSAVEHSRASGSHMAVLFIDLDNFKNINDTLGHEAGDELLKTAARRLKATVRTSDHVIRLGGDEFTIVLQQVEAVEHVARVAGLIVAGISEPFVLAGTHGHRINASIGISMFPRDGDDGETLLKHADIAMYAAKAAGKGRFQFYHTQLSDALISKLSREQALRQATEKDEFVVHYQPRVEAGTGKINSMEALVRWADPERGLVLPHDFIALAEDTGMVLRMGELVIEKVCSQLAQWRAQHVPLLPVSINVSPSQLMHGNISAFLAACMNRHGIGPQLIEVELTESAVIDNSPVVVKQLASLRTMGIKLSIDDFGSGYSSLAQLQRLDVDVLKVDRVFTTCLNQGSEGRVLFKAIVSMAKALDMCVVAEGVETAEQLETLQTLSCDEIQGFYISKPVPGDEIPRLIVKNILFPTPQMPVKRAAI